MIAHLRCVTYFLIMNFKNEIIITFDNSLSKCGINPEYNPFTPCSLYIIISEFNTPL